MHLVPPTCQLATLESHLYNVDIHLPCKYISGMIKPAPSHVERHVALKRGCWLFS